MGAQNVIMGNQADPTSLPETQVDDSQFQELQKTARFSKSAEFKALKSYIDERIMFYQTYLPRGENPAAEKELTDAQIGEHWRVANLINGEFKQMLYIYENASEMVKEELARRAAVKARQEELDGGTA